jgi:Mn2+/Fe2+ NRAMP family transporter
MSLNDSNTLSESKDRPTPTRDDDPDGKLSLGIKEPPKTLWEAFQQIGPGIILAGTIVGSGELILTTGMGARHGFVFLWLVLFSCVIKVFIQVELGRFAISSAQPTLEAIHNISRYRWIGLTLMFWWLFMTFCTVFQLGGMTGGVAQSLDMAFPSVGRWFQNTAELFPTSVSTHLSQHPETGWALLTCLATIVLIFRGSYRRIEGFTTLMVIGVTIITILCTAALWWTAYAPSTSSILDGFVFHIPPNGVADAFAVFGITGVGATELFYYPYWCIEKGYAKYVGPKDGSIEWEQRARGWIRVMNLDAWTSMIVFTLSTLAFYFMGAAVLHPQGLDPKGKEMIATLSEMYMGPFGSWTQVLFLIGAGAVLFKTLYLACAANSRMLVDFFGLLRSKKYEDRQRIQWTNFFCFVFPLVALGLYLFARDPQLMVRIGGSAQAATLPMMAFATLYFRYFQLDPRLKPKLATDIMMWIAAISISIVAIYSVPDAVAKIFR